MQAIDPNLSIEQNLLNNGYRHERTPNSDNTGKHLLIDIATYQPVGVFTAWEAIQWLQDAHEMRGLIEKAIAKDKARRTQIAMDVCWQYYRDAFPAYYVDSLASRIG